MSTSSNYGHVKLSSSFSSTGSDGVAASEAAVSNCYNNLNSKLKQGSTVCGSASYNSFGTLASGLTCNWCNIVHHAGMQMLTISMDLSGSMINNTAIFINTNGQISQSASSNATQLTFTITFFYS